MGHTETLFTLNPQVNFEPNASLYYYRMFSGGSAFTVAFVLTKVIIFCRLIYSTVNM